MPTFTDKKMMDDLICACIEHRTVIYLDGLYEHTETKKQDGLKVNYKRTAEVRKGKVIKMDRSFSWPAR